MRSGIHLTLSDDTHAEVGIGPRRSTVGPDVALIFKGLLDGQGQNREDYVTVWLGWGQAHVLAAKLADVLSGQEPQPQSWKRQVS